MRLDTQFIQERYVKSFFHLYRFLVAMFFQEGFLIDRLPEMPEVLHL